MQSITLTIVVFALATALLAGGLHHVVSKTRQLEINFAVKLAVAFFIGASVLVIILDTYAYFKFYWPSDEMPDYRRTAILYHSITGMIFLLPILLNRINLLAFSLYYIAINIVLGIIFGYLLGIAQEERLIFSIVKLVIVMGVLVWSLRPLPNRRNYS